jgi:hypothetical protein
LKKTREALIVEIDGRGGCYSTSTFLYATNP